MLAIGENEEGVLQDIEVVRAEEGSCHLWFGVGNVADQRQASSVRQRKNQLAIVGKKTRNLPKRNV